ncbi:hypothetical protein [Nocardia sp. NPDC050175]|uniref:hypothetical protein n=1 Tax=Nocardia sp. NPDC050175 TaxID=3364317 RepID=UPI0037941CC9
MGLAKHRRKKQEAPVDYGTVLVGAAVIAGALVLVRWLRAKEGIARGFMDSTNLSGVDLGNLSTNRQDIGRAGNFRKRSIEYRTLEHGVAVDRCRTGQLAKERQRVESLNVVQHSHRGHLPTYRMVEVDRFPATRKKPGWLGDFKP